MTDTTIPARFRPASTLTLGWNNGLLLLESLMQPLVLVASLLAMSWVIDGRLRPTYLVISVLVFALTFPGQSELRKPVWRFARDLLPGWVLVAGLVALLSHLGGFLDLRNEPVLLAWAAIAVPVQLLVHGALRHLARSMQPELRRAVIVGRNENGLDLARCMQRNPYVGTRLLGFFDDRDSPRTPSEKRESGPPLLGTLAELPAYTRSHRVQVVYLSLPMVAEPRILGLLEKLCDTTASIYFLPRLFVTELMQGRMDSVDDLSLVSVCETPFRGVNALVKRASDIVLSILILIAISPLLALIAAAVRLDSPGPAVFRQRRYGLDGEEIVVSKFRSMKVCEDGASISQATRDDDRVTKLGAFLRRTSLDELPQFFNVLQGRMSIVGPRPHAVAHNELYRNLIKGYMVRHKVRPGITGWAQVNGCRGATDTVEKMKLRIDYDLAYLRGWSLTLDLYIIFKTALIVATDRNAY